jgi:hypothetical protein
MNLLKRKFIGILLVSFFLMLCVFINNTFASTIYNGTPSGSVLNIKIDYVLSDDEGNTKPDGSNTFITGESFNITFVGNISVD